MEHLSTYAIPFVITGDMNERFNRPKDPTIERLIQILSAVDVVQCVDQSTHDQGGTLDVVIIHKDSQPSAVAVIDVGDEYDHRLLSWSFHI